MKVLDYSGTSVQLANLCKEKGYSAKQIAEAVGVTPQTVYRWFDPKNKRLCSIDNTVFLCDNILNLKVDDIIIRKDI